MEPQIEEMPAGAPPFGAAIPIPEYFPVTWKNPEDAQQFWTHDRMHFPAPLTPLMEAVFNDHFYLGIQKAFREYAAPGGFVADTFNGYMYNSPRLFVPPDELETAAARHEELLGAAMAQLADRWETFLAELKDHVAAWESFDLAAASNAELLAHLDKTMIRGTRAWLIHFLTVFPAYQAVSLFDDMYRDLFGNASALDAYKLLQGFDNLTLQTALALWRLSRRALESPGLRAILEERSASEVIPALEETEEGRAFLADFRAYLAEYGQRPYELDLASTTWIEDPTLPLKMLKDYVSQPERDVPAEMAALAEERERLVAEARARLEEYPQPVVEKFEFFLQAAQVGNVLTEDHSFWVDFRCMYHVRRVLVECGRRLAPAIIERPEDLFFLTLDEVRAGLRGDLDDARGTVGERRERYDYFRGVQAPPVLGTMPEGPPPDDPGTRFINKFFGVPPQPPIAPGALQGAPGSSGVVRGPARVIRSLTEADKLRKGDILVCETTAPPWSPLFAVAAGIVTDTGGPLSHCAIVAREYGLPAVVGTGMGTVTFRDGQAVEVDGNTGIVRSLDE